MSPSETTMTMSSASEDAIRRAYLDRQAALDERRRRDAHLVTGVLVAQPLGELANSLGELDLRLVGEELARPSDVRVAVADVARTELGEISGAIATPRPAPSASPPRRRWRRPVPTLIAC